MGACNNTAGTPVGKPEHFDRHVDKSDPTWMETGKVAGKHAECPICFEALYRGRLGVFLNSAGKRVGPQFFRYEAAEEWIAESNDITKECPVTHQPVASVALVPSILEDPKGWFRVCDVDGDRKLSRLEVVEALKAQVPLDNAALDRFVTNDAAWREWDADGSGFIEYVEIMDESKGLLGFIKSTFAGRQVDKPIPDIKKDRHGWYQRWDEDGSGELELEEVIRAFAKSFNIGVSGLAQLRESLRAVWPVFDVDGSGAVDKKEFLQPREGLCDTVIATMATG